jgi:hypothetical protein
VKADTKEKLRRRALLRINFMRRMAIDMVSKYFLKTKSPTFAELLADRGHPGPKIFKLKFDDFKFNELSIHF